MGFQVMMLGLIHMEEIRFRSIVLVCFTLVSLSKDLLINEAILVISPFIDLEDTILVFILTIKSYKGTNYYSIQSVH